MFSESKMMLLTLPPVISPRMVSCCLSELALLLQGILIWVSSHPDEQGKELLHVNISQSNIVHMSASDDGARFGICTDNLVKVFQTDLGKMRHTEAALAKDVKLRKLSWTSDGKLILS